jgi:hypothetical protein
MEANTIMFQEKKQATLDDLRKRKAAAMTVAKENVVCQLFRILFGTGLQIIAQLLSYQQERREAYAKKLKAFPSEEQTTSKFCCKRKCLFGEIPMCVLNRTRQAFLDLPTQVCYFEIECLH